MARGSAAADFDNDGDLDLAINVIGGSAVLLVNQSGGNWLEIGLPQFAPNARAVVTLADGRKLVRELHIGSSYLASEDPRLHFGLGDQTAVEQIDVTWGDGRRVTLTDVAANQLITVR